MNTLKSTPNIAPKQVKVSAAVIERDGLICLSRRLDNVHQGGKWEFPGGKVEMGESAKAALKRELKEELNIDALAMEPLIQVPHNYVDKSVVLNVFHVTEFSGEPEGLEGQRVEWFEKSKLSGLTFPDANFPILSAIKLPKVCAITPADWLPDEHGLQALEKTVQARALLILRLPMSKAKEYRAIAKEVAKVCQAEDCRLMLTSTYEEVKSIDADGLHLSSRRLMEFDAVLDDEDCLLSASCHNPLELARASKLKLDFALLSPVNQTASHPDAKPLGWERFAKLVASVTIPVYALGGMQLSDIDLAKQNGAQGIAAIREAWRTVAKIVM